MRLTLPVSPLAGAPCRSGWLRFVSPCTFYGWAGRMVPWCWGAAALFGVGGLIAGLLVAPSDFQQGDAYRITFIHLPAAWMSMTIYLTMALLAGLGLALSNPLATLLVAALAPTGALMAFIALWTGALWDKPVWGVWWVWEARLVSQLLLLGLCVGFLVLRATIANQRHADRLGAVALLLGAATVPVLYLSMASSEVPALNELAGAAATPGVVAIHSAMPLMLAAFLAWSAGVGLHRARSIILEQEIDADWVRELPEAT